MAATATAVMPVPYFDKGDEADDALNGNGRLGDPFALQVKNTFIDLANVQDEEELNTSGIMDAFSKRQMSEPPPSLGAHGLGIKNRYFPWFESLATGANKEEEVDEEPGFGGQGLPRKHSGMPASVCSDLISDPLGPAEEPPTAMREGAEPMRVQTSQSHLAAVAAVAAALELAQQKAPQPAPVPAPVPGVVPGMEGFADDLQGMSMVPGDIDGAVVPPADWANTTTVMMRNLPNKYTQRMLLTEINHTGFLGTFDFLYLPIDPDTNANRGYAFLNFIDPGFAWMFKMSYENRKMNRFNSNKVVSVMPATLQGFEANYSHYSSARVNRGDPAARPLFLRDPTFKHAAGFGGQAADARGSRGGRRRRGAGAGSSTNLERVALAQHMSQANTMFGGVAPHEFGPGPIGSVYFGVEPKEVAMEESMGGAAAMVPKFCPHCGAAIQPTFQFCPSCGEGLNFASA